MEGADGSDGFRGQLRLASLIGGGDFGSEMLEGSLKLWSRGCCNERQAEKVR